MLAQLTLQNAGQHNYAVTGPPDGKETFLRLNVSFASQISLSLLRGVRKGWAGVN